MAGKTNIQKDKQSQAGKTAAEKRKAAKATAEETKESQQEPEQDSGLQTPQPDQPMPTETERREQEPRKDDRQSPPRREDGPDDQPEQDSEEQPAQPEQFTKHVQHGGRSFRADVAVKDHVGLERQRQDELAEARAKHNERVGNPDVSAGSDEFWAALEQHNTRSKHRFDEAIEEESGEEQEDESQFAATGRKAG